MKHNCNDLRCEQVTFDQLFPLACYFLGDFGETIPWQVDEVELAVDLIEIDQLRTSGPGTGKRQPLATREAVQQTGFADVASAQKRNLRQRLGGN